MKALYIITLLICVSICHKLNSHKYKSEWPELVGMDSNLARTKIL